MGKLKTRHKRNKTKPKHNKDFEIATISFEDAMAEIFEGNILSGGYDLGNGVQEDWIFDKNGDIVYKPINDSEI